MASISVKGEYALHALFDLACQPAGTPIKIAEIARRQKIPQKFLELILAGLKQAGFVESRRGAEGGYLLAQAADTIRIGDVLRHVDGARTSPNRNGKKKPDTPFTTLWADVESAISAVVDETTVADVVRRWQDRQTRYIPNWDI